MSTTGHLFPTVINVRSVLVVDDVPYGGRVRYQPLPADVVYIGRANRHYGLTRSIWANPYVIAHDQPRTLALTRYEAYLRTDRPDLLDRLDELIGKRLACWCAPDHPCHGDVLVRLLTERLVANYG